MRLKIKTNQECGGMCVLRYLFAATWGVIVCAELFGKRQRVYPICKTEKFECYEKLLANPIPP